MTTVRWAGFLVEAIASAIGLTFLYWAIWGGTLGDAALFGVVTGLLFAIASLVRGGRTAGDIIVSRLLRHSRSADRPEH